MQNAEKEIRDQIRSLGLRWSRFQKEWYGASSDLDVLIALIKNRQHNIEILQDV